MKIPLIYSCFIFFAWSIIIVYIYSKNNNDAVLQSTLLFTKNLVQKLASIWDIIYWLKNKFMSYTTVSDVFCVRGTSSQNIVVSTGDLGRLDGLWAVTNGDSSESERALVFTLDELLCFFLIPLPKDVGVWRWVDEGWSCWGVCFVDDFTATSSELSKATSVLDTAWYTCTCYMYMYVVDMLMNSTS